MAEVFGNHNKYINGIDVKGDKISDGCNESQIKEKVKEYILQRVQEGISQEEYKKLLRDIKTFLERQDVEKLNLQEEFAKQREIIIGETGRNVENEKRLEIVQNMIYSELKIDGNLENNTNTKKFVKGVVDGLIFNNIELVEELVSKGVDELVSMLKNLLNLEVIKEIIKDFASSFGDILETFQNPYLGGVAIGGMGLGIIGKSMKGLKIASKAEKIESKLKGDLDIIGGVKVNELYERHPNLENYQDVFHPNDKARVLGEGTKGFVLANEKFNFVGKIPINSEAYPILLGEIKKQRKFYNMIELGRKNGDVPEWIKVPSVKDEIKSKGLLLAMDKVDGNSLTTYRYKDHYRSLPGFKNEKLDGLSDYEVKLLLEKKYDVNRGELDSMVMDVEQSLQKFFPSKLEGYKKTIQYLKDNKLEHKDLHSGNVMIGRNGDLFLIDFDSSNFSK